MRGTKQPRTAIDVRDVAIEVVGDHRSLRITACVVSGLQQLLGVNVNLAAFDNHGHFLNSNGQSIGDIPNPTTHVENSQPAMHFASGASFQISPAGSANDHVDDLALVTVK